MLVLGIDVGGTNIRLGLINEHYGLSNFSIVKTQEIVNGHNAVDKIIQCVRNYCDMNNHGEIPEVISIGFPSTIDKSRRVVKSTPNIKGLNDISLADIMEDALGATVYVNRDVNFLLLYDLQALPYEKSSIIIGFYLGTGIGNAISINGKLLLGKNGVAAELGHIPIMGKSCTCGCGNIGCAETVVSGIYLEKLQKECFPNTSIDQLFERHAKAPEIKEFIDAMAVVITTEINIFDPNYVILGGGVLQMSGFPKALLEKNIQKYIRKPYPGDHIKIIYSEPNQENGVIGAGIYAYNRINDEEYL